MTSPATMREFKSHGEQLAEEELERQKKRSHQLEEQRSDLNPPEHRIRIWEQAHGLRMPLDPEHPILDVISVDTGLSVAQVQEEQRLRAARNANRGHG